MNKMHAAAAIAALAFAGLSFAQAPGPADGAITGGSITPGETGGVPDGRKVPTMPSDRAASRCNDLSGTLREECLLQERGVSSGGTRPPAPGPAQPPPSREAPPPQNPR